MRGGRLSGAAPAAGEKELGVTRVTRFAVPLGAALLVPLLEGAALKSLAAQATGGWSPSLYPSGCALSGNSGPLLGIGAGFTERADSLDPWPVDARISGGFGYGLRGSWFASLSFRAPGLWPGWRVVAQAYAQRQLRFEFIGLGIGARYDPTLVTDTRPHYYQIARTRHTLNVEGTRALASGVSVALALSVARAELDSLPGGSVFGDSLGPQLMEVDRSARGTVLIDRRDLEADPHRGFMLELGATLASGGGGYRRLTSIGRGYVPVGRRGTFAVRLAASGTVRSPPLDARFTIPVWEGSIDVLGGPGSHRGLRSQRFVGRHVVFGNLELRERFGAWRGVEFLGLGFVDAGRVFEAEPFAVTVSHLKVGAGLGLGARVKGGSIILFHAARGPDGFVFSGRSGWMF